jgi:hypothetical protein
MCGGGGEVAGRGEGADLVIAAEDTEKRVRRERT